MSESRRGIEQLVEDHFDFVWRVARRMSRDRADADDLSQEAFIVLARRLGDVVAGSERAFLFSTVLRLSATRRRRQRRRPEHLVTSLDDRRAQHLDPEQLSELSHARPLLQEVLESLPDAQRAVFVLHELEEMPLSEVAALLEIPTGTAASRLRAARLDFAQAVQRLQAREHHALGGTPHATPASAAVHSGRDPARKKR